MLARKLKKELVQQGYYLKRKGKKHDLYTNGLQDIAIPRGRVNDKTATRIRTEAKRNKNKVGGRQNDTIQ